MGHLTFVSKRLSAVGSKRISQFFDPARERRSLVIALVDFTWIFLLLSFYIVISWNMSLFKVWSEDKLNKKFVVAENFAELVSTAALTCLEVGDLTLFEALTGGAFDRLTGNIAGNLTKIFQKSQMPRGLPGGGMGGFGIDRYITYESHMAPLIDD